MNGRPEADGFLDGLDMYTIPAMGDQHPIQVYGIQSKNIHYNNNDKLVTSKEDCIKRHRRPILLLHGRTWSAIPVYHLLGGKQENKSSSSSSSSISLMEELYNTGILQPYCMDFRGFGGTIKDKTGCVEPNRCVLDTESVLVWIAHRHGLTTNNTDDSTNNDSGNNDTNSLEDDDSLSSVCNHCEMPALLGWSQGALIAQMAAQQKPDWISKLVLYGSIYDPQIRYQRPPLYTSNTNANASASVQQKEEILNNHESAIEDFTIEGTIQPESAKRFAQVALICDPIKARWRHLHQFNNCDPRRVQVPTLVVAGDQDPYAPLHAQAELFNNLGANSDRTWSILSNADHAVHLLDGRHRFIKIVTNFVENEATSKNTKK